MCASNLAVYGDFCYKYGLLKTIFGNEKSIIIRLSPGLFSFKIGVVNKTPDFGEKKRNEWSINPFMDCQEEVIHNAKLPLRYRKYSFPELLPSGGLQR
jgi:hypothetical protein